MLKVSFKDQTKKVQVFNNKATVVTIKGTIKALSFWYDIPMEIRGYLENHPTVDFYTGSEWDVIEVSGKSVCSSEDTFDLVLGMRIAESRAKIKLYKTMYIFAKKLYQYYVGLIVGNGSFMDNSNEGLSAVVDKYLNLWDKEEDHLRCLLHNEPDTESLD